THRLPDRRPDPRCGRRLRRSFRYGHAESFDICEIAPAARRREDAIVEPNVGVDAAGKDRAGEQKVRANESHSRITWLEAMRELLWQHDQCYSIAASRHMHPAPNNGELHVVRGHKGSEVRPL